MMQLSVEQIRSLRNRYLDLPYPGFSLDEVCRRRRLAHTKLERGANAWVATGTAQTTEEWVSRLVQGCLNKLTESNFDIMLDKLRTRELFAADTILDNVVSMIFSKALAEPENSKLYASLCFNLAMYEVSLTEQQTNRPRSHLRNAVVATAQQEFRSTAEMNIQHADHGTFTDEEREERRTELMKRKRANMRFVGQLFLSDVLSHSTMITIMDITMKEASEGGFPPSENIELLAELLRTVGERLDRQKKKAMDHHFTLLAGLIKDDKHPYPIRIKFKIQDLVDLRKAGWLTKAKSTSTQSQPLPSSHSFKGGNRTSSASPLSPSASRKPTFGKTTTTMTPASSNAGCNGAAGVGMTDRNAKDGKVTTATAAAAAASSATGLAGRAPPRNAATSATAESWINRAVGAPTTTPTASSAAAAAAASSSSSTAPAATASLLSAGESATQKSADFETRVRSMFEEWAANRTNDFLPQWIDQFNECDRAFANVEELCSAVAMEVIKAACSTTRREAQREAYSFLIVGLYLTDEEVLRGFAGALAAALEDGLIEDVPRFPDRYMQMLRLTSSEVETNVDVYYDAANVLRMGYNMLTYTDDTVVASILDFWSRVPPAATQRADAAEEEGVCLTFPVLYSLFETSGAKSGLEKLLAGIVHRMHQMGIVEDSTLEELLTFDDDNALCIKVAAQLRFLQQQQEARSAS